MGARLWAAYVSESRNSSFNTACCHAQGEGGGGGGGEGGGEGARIGKNGRREGNREGEGDEGENVGSVHYGSKK